MRKQVLIIGALCACSLGTIALLVARRAPDLPPPVREFESSGAMAHMEPRDRATESAVDTLRAFRREAVPIDPDAPVVVPPVRIEVDIAADLERTCPPWRDVSKIIATGTRGVDLISDDGRLRVIELVEADNFCCGMMIELEFDTREREVRARVWDYRDVEPSDVYWRQVRGTLRLTTWDLHEPHVLGCLSISGRTSFRDTSWIGEFELP